MIRTRTLATVVLALAVTTACGEDRLVVSNDEADGGDAAGPGGTGGGTAAGGSGGVTATGGSAGAMAEGGAGGVTATGGSVTATGGSGMDASPGVGGTTVTGGSAGTDAALSVSCAFSQTAELSAQMGTVGIVKWSTDLPGVQSARIDFGLSAAYEMTAPVDLSAPEHRTLLLGMKQSRMYHYRIVAASAQGECTSPDYTITTQALAVAAPSAVVVTKSTASQAFGGFLLLGQQGPPPGGVAFIVDGDGDVVWAFGTAHDVSGVRMSADGKHMWINSSNVPSSQARVRRVSMDGLVDEDFSAALAGLHGHLAVLPDDSVAFVAYGTGGCDDIKELVPATRTVRTVTSAASALGAKTCNLNSIQYSRADDALLVSDIESQGLAKIARADGRPVWVMNGVLATLRGTPWRGSQAGFHVLSPERLVLFNNNSRTANTAWSGTGDGSLAMEVAVDLVAGEAKRTWSYKSAVQNDVMGDVQRLSNGNTVVGFSAKGVVHEVDAGGVVLQEWTWAEGTVLGYLEKRAALYGEGGR